MAAEKQCRSESLSADDNRSNLIELAKSQLPSDRRKAAECLRFYPGQDTLAALRKLLTDDSETIRRYANDEIYSISYDVRYSAQISLDILGERHPELQVERLPTADEQKAIRRESWVRQFGEALTDGWSVVSVTDGDTKIADGRPKTAVFVNCRNSTSTCQFILIPKEWPNVAPREAIYLGNTGLHAQGGRHFYVKGDYPAELRERIVRYFCMGCSE